MAEATIRHTYDCSADDYWQSVFFDEDFNKRLYLEHLGFERWQILSQEDDGNTVRRVVDIVPAVGDLPAPLKKLAGGGIAYHEEGTLDRKANLYRYRALPNTLKDKLTITGEMSVKPAGEGRCERVLNLNVTAKIFGVGGMLEKRIVDDVRRNYEDSHRFTVTFLSQKAS